MASADSPEKLSSEDFFAELENGRRVEEEDVDGRMVELFLRSPSIEDTEAAYNIIEGLNYESDIEIEKNRLIQIACRSCIQGVTSDNVMVFLSYFPPMCRLFIKCLRLLKIGEDDMRRLDIDPDDFDYNDGHPF